MPSPIGYSKQDSNPLALLTANPSPHTYLPRLTRSYLGNPSYPFHLSYPSYLGYLPAIATDREVLSRSNDRAFKRASFSIVPQGGIVQKKNCH